jgi:hypothetical protein
VERRDSLTTALLIWWNGQECVSAENADSVQELHQSAMEEVSLRFMLIIDTVT